MAGKQATRRDRARSTSMRRRRRWPFFVAGAVAGSALVLWAQGLQLPWQSGPPEGWVQQPTPVVVQAVRSLARLESSTYYMRQTVDLKHRERSLFGLVEADDAIVLVAVGEVIAGVDLEKLAEEDLEVDPEDGRATLHLPSARILTSRLDNERTYVRERDTDLLAGRHEDLEAEARERAERALRNAALEAGILDRARQSAAHTLRKLVQALGYHEVDIRWREEE